MNKQVIQKIQKRFKSSLTITVLCSMMSSQKCSCSLNSFRKHSHSGDTLPRCHGKVDNSPKKQNKTKKKNKNFFLNNFRYCYTCINEMYKIMCILLFFVIKTT